MKRYISAILLLGVVLLLTQCSIFTKTLNYRVDGSSSSIVVLYQAKDTGLSEVTAQAPWSSGDIILWSNETPFVAFIQVQNNHSVNTVTVYITEDEENAITPFQVGPGQTGTGYVIIY